MIFRSALVIAALVAAFSFALNGMARSHGWYPVECCSDKDCEPLPSADVEEVEEGFVIKSTGEFIHRSKARVAPDDQFHICRYETSKAIICFFQPFKGV